MNTYALSGKLKLDILKTIPLSITKNIEIFRYKFNKIVKGSLYKTIIF